MKRMLLAAAATAAALLAMMAGTARADAADHFTFSVSGQPVSPAGTLCDFNEQDTFTVNGIVTLAPNGAGTVVQDIDITHTNLDTGYSLSEVDHVIANQVEVRGTVINVGLFWHLRDASGKIVLVKAGGLTFDATTGEFIRFTPNSGWDETYAQTLCPLLGGRPAI